MRFHADQFIHQLSVAEIQTILTRDFWQTENQSITSAITNDNNLLQSNQHWMDLGENTSGINAFVDIPFAKNVRKILDVGGGRFDCNREFMQQNRGINLLVWDPYNRSQEHNLHVQAEVTAQQVDAVTSMSVLNVIPEISVRLAHINTVKKALRMDGNAYFKVWSGDKPLQGSYLPCATENSFQANAFADRFLTEIEVVFGVGNVTLDASVPNLIVARKNFEGNISRKEIVALREKSILESFVFDRLKERSLNKLQRLGRAPQVPSTLVRGSDISITTDACLAPDPRTMCAVLGAGASSSGDTRQRFFSKLEKSFLEKNRHHDPKIQHEYDKQFGLIISSAKPSR